VFTALRYYWETAKGYRFRPWDSPYIRWRMRRFLHWAAERRAVQSRARF
jgi:hypothetical protein